ncbi:MAG: hypothetical protein NT007_05955 [Candidatus Kapabacteria bacterium]|nr:hypothetical protein [Candidatus Kapabacteria bacterium]
MKHKRLYLSIVGLIALISIIWALSETSYTWKIPSEIAGSTWLTKQKVTIRFENVNGYSFLAAPDSVDLFLNISLNGKVTGNLGNATFQGCSVHKNRGWVGRMLNIATDYTIRGKLKGSIFPSDTIMEKEIMMPMGIENNSLHGTIFQKSGVLDIYPMLSFKLKKLN